MTISAPAPAPSASGLLPRRQKPSSRHLQTGPAGRGPTPCSPVCRWIPAADAPAHAYPRRASSRAMSESRPRGPEVRARSPRAHAVGKAAMLGSRGGGASVSPGGGVRRRHSRMPSRPVIGSARASLREDIDIDLPPCSPGVSQLRYMPPILKTAIGHPSPLRVASTYEATTSLNEHVGDRLIAQG